LKNKKKKLGNNLKANLSAFTMRLGSVGRVEEVNRSDLDSHSDCCVCGKKVLVFNDFDREVTVTGWDPEGENQSLRINSAAMGYTIPQSGQTVLLIAHQSIFSPSLNHNLFSTMQMRLHDVIVNETPKFQSLNPTKPSHSISVRDDNVDIKLLPLPHPPVRARTDTRTNPSAQRATQLRSVLARVYAVTRQNQITNTVP
jgi:hypothetical protein